MKHSDIWSGSYELPGEDRRLLKEALDYVRHQAVPEPRCRESAYSPEIEYWNALDISSIDALAADMRASGFTDLTPAATAYLLPGLLALCFLDKTLYFQHQLLWFLSLEGRSPLQFLDQDSIRLCERLLERILTIGQTDIPELLRAYPGLAILANPHAIEVQGGFRDLVLRLIKPLND